MNFEAEAEYIARASPAAARRVVAATDRSVQYLACYPSVGRPGQLAGTRELVVPDTAYVISYRVHERRVEALRVFHGARKWSPKR